MQGKRTVIFGLACLFTLLLGFSLLPDADRGAAFVFFSAGVGAMMAAVAGKASVDALAQGGGVKGAVATLMTEAKPPEEPAK